MTVTEAYEAGVDDERQRVVTFLKGESKRIRDAGTKLMSLNDGDHATAILALDSMGVAILEVAVQIERGLHDATTH